MAWWLNFLRRITKDRGGSQTIPSIEWQAMRWRTTAMKLRSLALAEATWGSSLSSKVATVCDYDLTSRLGSSNSMKLARGAIGFNWRVTMWEAPQGLWCGDKVRYDEVAIKVRDTVWGWDQSERLVTRLWSKWECWGWKKCFKKHKINN
jgi:hypothetical protein